MGIMIFRITLYKHLLKDGDSSFIDIISNSVETTIKATTYIVPSEPMAGEE